MDQKRQWTQELKRLMLDHFSTEIPSKTKQMLMQLGTQAKDEGTILEYSVNTVIQCINAVTESFPDRKPAKKRMNPVPKYLEKRRKSADASVELRALKKNMKHPRSVQFLFSSFPSLSHSSLPLSSLSSLFPSARTYNIPIPI